MKKEYVYIGRKFNHKGDFHDQYFKIGRSKQYKLRETQLNNTNEPTDYYNIRVFETNDMIKTEATFQICFMDYRVIKKYKDRKPIRTEWFYFDEDEILHDRIDRLIKQLDNVVEIDLTNDVNEDVDTTKEIKEQIITSFRKAKSRLHLTYNNEDISQETSTETYLLCLRKIAEQTGWEKIMENEIRVTKTFQELEERNTGSNTSQIKEYDGYFIFTGNNNDVKSKVLNKLIKKLSIKDLHIGIKK